MRKITFITLMMILGMSSVSFGNEKMYLCIPDKGVSLGGSSDSLDDSNELSGYKYIVKTEDDDSKMVSVKEVGKDYFFCKSGEVLRDNMYLNITSGVGESIKGGYVLTCRHPHTREEGGHTQNEFNLNLRKMIFNSYFMYFNMVRIGYIHSGKCEEI